MAVITGFLKKKKNRKRQLRAQKYTRYEINDPNGMLEGEVFLRKTVKEKGRVENFRLQARDTVYLVYKD